MSSDVDKQSKFQGMRLINLYAEIAAANNAMMRSVDRITLFQKICSAMVGQGDIRLAWIGVLDKAGKNLSLAESAGGSRVPDSMPWLLDTETSLDAQLALGAVSDNRPCISNHVERESSVLAWQSAAPGGTFCAAAFLPIHQHGHVIGALGLYATEADYFSDSLIEPLLNMMQNIALALDGLAHESKRRAGALIMHESEARHRRLFETSPEAIYIEQDGKFVQVNAACVNLYHVNNAEALIGQRVIDFVQPDYHDQYRQRLKTLAEEGSVLPFAEKQYLHGDGSAFDVEVAATAIYYQGKQAYQLVARDISERKNTERILRLLAEGTTLSKGDEFFQQLVRHLASALQVRYAVVAECLDEKLTRARVLAFWKDGDWLPSYDYDIANTPCQVLFQGDGVCYFPNNVQDHFPGNLRLPELDAACYLGMTLNDGNKAIGHIFVIHDKPLANELQAKSILSIFAARASTELLRKDADDRIAYLAHYDALTGLPNRALLQDRIERAVINARRHEAGLALLFLDLDRFKNINDTLGHQAGDLCLQEMARRLNNILRESDTVARLGGDEFMLLVQDYAGLSHVGEVAQRIVEAISEPFMLEGQEFSLSASIGIAAYPTDGNTTEDLIKNADIAMYRAKDMGRDNYQFYSVLANVHTLEHLSLEPALRHAILDAQLVLHYQPKVDFLTNRIIGAEALVRWQHPQQGLLGPEKFIPLAEETGLIVKLGEWVIEQACIQAIRWPQQKQRDISVAVNLSARQFAYQGLLPFISRVLDDTGLNPLNLEFEITESVLMHNPEQAIQIMQKLRELGVRISLDDFGTGYSSLAYLKKFPIDTIKIDRSFIRDIPADQGDAAITRAIIAMARGMNKTVIAEGVETREQFEFLQELQCNEFQGYYFSKPLPAEEFLSLLLAAA